MKPVILIVEDDLDIQDSLGTFFNMEGLLSMPAYNGEDALNYLRANPPPDAILLDLMMPVMNGYEFLERFEKLGESVTKIPIVILSASKDAKTYAGKRGFHFVGKPFELRVLRKALATILPSR